MRKLPHSYRLLFLFFVWSSLLNTSCSWGPKLQQRINSLTSTHRFDEAVDLLLTHKNGYGNRNTLLYLMDKGYLLHITGKYKESIQAFEAAKVQLDQLYTKSLSNIATTWIINDYLAPYRGEDFEHIAINIFQAMNYTMLNNISEALVEARDVDIKLSLINNLYEGYHKNVYREDALARFLMGILYECADTISDLNNAFISYQKAFKIYQNDYQRYYSLKTPLLLIKNLLATSEYLDRPQFYDFQTQFPQVNFAGIIEKREKAEVYLIQYNGLSPIKYPSSFPIPSPEGYIAEFSFPEYHRQFYKIKASTLSATNTSGDIFESSSELVQDIEAIAVRNLEDRKTRVMTKAVARPLAKHFLEKSLGRKIVKGHGRSTARIFKGLSNWYNLYSEQADLRSWQTLPAQIRIAHLLLNPGTYQLSLSYFDENNSFIGEDKLGEFFLQAGEKKFLIKRTVR